MISYGRGSADYQEAVARGWKWQIFTWVGIKQYPQNRGWIKQLTQSRDILNTQLKHFWQKFLDFRFKLADYF